MTISQSFVAMSFFLMGCSPVASSPSALGDTWIAPPDGSEYDANYGDMYEPGPQQSESAALRGELCDPATKLPISQTSGQAAPSGCKSAVLAAGPK